VQDQPVVRVAPLVARDEFRDVVLHAARRRREGEAKPVRDAEDVRIHRERGFLERDRHHDVRGLPADARQGFERLALARYFARVLGN
jgi:hypothetical protein